MDITAMFNIVNLKLLLVKSRKIKKTHKFALISGAVRGKAKRTQIWIHIHVLSLTKKCPHFHTRQGKR